MTAAGLTPRLAGAPILEPVLSPRFVNDEGDRVRQVEAAIAGAHGNGELLLRRNEIQHLRREAAALRAEDERITGLETGLRIDPRATGLDGEQARAVQCFETGIQPLMQSYRREVIVVEPRAPGVLVVKVEAERLHQVQGAPGVGAQADRIARIRWNLGLKENDMKHEASRLTYADPPRGGRASVLLRDLRRRGRPVEP